MFVMQKDKGHFSYLINDDVPSPLTGGSQHLLEAPGRLLDHLLPLALVVLLAGLTVHLEIRRIKILDTGDTAMFFSSQGSNSPSSC